MASVMQHPPSQQDLDAAVEVLTTALIHASAVRAGVTLTHPGDIPRGFFRTMAKMALALTDERAFDNARAGALRDIEDRLEDLLGPDGELCREAIDRFADRLMALGGRS